MGTIGASGGTWRRQLSVETDRLVQSLGHEPDAVAYWREPFPLDSTREVFWLSLNSPREAHMWHGAVAVGDTAGGYWVWVRALDDFRRVLVASQATEEPSAEATCATGVRLLIPTPSESVVVVESDAGQSTAGDGGVARTKVEVGTTGVEYHCEGVGASFVFAPAGQLGRQHKK
jgi:hypothetical protein